MGISHDMIPYLILIDDIFTILKAELNDKQLIWYAFTSGGKIFHHKEKS